MSEKETPPSSEYFDKLVQRIEAQFRIRKGDDWLTDKQKPLKRFRDMLTHRLKKAVLEDPRKAALLNDSTPYHLKTEEERKILLNQIRIHKHYEFDLRTLKTSLRITDTRRNVQARTQNAFAVFCGYESYAHYLNEAHKEGEEEHELNHPPPVQPQGYKTNAFLSFQERFTGIQKEWSANVNKENWMPTEAESRAVERYWHLVYDEWYLCKRLDTSLQRLWDEYYLKGVRNALQNPQFLKSLNYLISCREFQKDFTDYMTELVAANPDDRF